MDPNANLAEQLEIACRLLGTDCLDKSDLPDAVRLAELVLALDEWIGQGGFLPSHWAHPRRV